MQDRRKRVPSRRQIASGEMSWKKNRRGEFFARSSTRYVPVAANCPAHRTKTHTPSFVDSGNKANQFQIHGKTFTFPTRVSLSTTHPLRMLCLLYKDHVSSKPSRFAFCFDLADTFSAKPLTFRRLLPSV